MHHNSQYKLIDIQKFLLMLILMVMSMSSAIAEDRILSRSYWEDASNQVSLDQAQANDFKNYTGVLSRGYTQSAVWIRLEISPPQDAHANDTLILRIRPIYLDEITLYDPLDTSNKLRVAGDKTNYGAEEYKSLAHTFSIPAGDKPRYVWLRLKATSTSLINVEAFTPEEMLSSEYKLLIGYCLVLSLILVFLILVFINWLNYREHLYAAFVMRHAIYLVYTASFFGFHRYVLDGVVDAKYLDLIYNWFVLGATGFSVWFESKFLAEYSPPAWAKYVSNATVKVNGTTVNSGSASGAIALTVGSNTITTVVTAQDGATTQTYTTTVTRAALLAQANLTVTASPNALTATTSTSTLSTSGGSGTGAVSYAMTAGTCALSGSTVTAGSANETCTVTATKAADGTYLAATAIVNISVTRRASIAAAATDASVASVHSAQLLQAQKFANTQIQNITNHLDTFRHNFNLQPSNFGFSINTPSLGQLAPVFYKVKDELTFRPNDQSDVSLQKTGYRQTGYPSKQMASLTDDYNNPDLLEQQSHQEAQQGQYVREPLSYSIWTAGTIDVGTFKSGDNKETTNKFRANGLTMGLDYKLSPAAIIGGAFGFGTGQNTADTLGNKVKSTQKTLTGYGMWGFGDTWVVDGLLGYGDLAFTGDRTTSDGLNLLSMNRKGTSTFGSASISKIFRFGGFKISPFVREDLLRINLGQYNETGAADYALGYDKTSYLTTTVSTGLHFAYDAYYDSGKLTTSAKISGNRAKTGSLSQDIYFADSGAAGGIYTLQQAASFQSSTSLHLGLMYTSKGGDAIDLGWMGAVGANQYKLNGLRFGLRFAM